MMSDFQLTADGKDIDLTSGGVALTSGVEAIRQRLLIRLKFVKGEYLLDTNLGIPYFEDVFKKDPDLLVVRSMFRSAIEETAGVVNITSFDLQVDGQSRTMSLNFSCTVDVTDEPLTMEVTL